MSSRLDVARYHKPLSVCIFGGGTLALLVAAAVCFMGGNVWLGIGLGIVFVLVAVPVSLYLLDMFVWEPRRAARVAEERMEEFNAVQRHRQDRVRQRERGLRD
jgi:hypothetical protein